VKLRLLRNKPSRLGKSSERKGIFIKLIRTELTVRNKLSIQILRKSKTYMSSMKRGSRRSKRSYKVLSRKRHYSNLKRINYQRELLKYKEESRVTKKEYLGRLRRVIRDRLWE
jgi:hypothetical protein